MTEWFYSLFSAKNEVMFFDVIRRLLFGIFIFFCFWIGSRILKAILKRVAVESPFQHDGWILVSQILTVAVLLIGAVTALGTIGINVTAMVAGLGFTGFALGFAFKDLLSSAIAGILLLIYTPFKKGDVISIQTPPNQGRVTQIDLRYTSLEHEGKKILIPNANILTTVITVESSSSLSESVSIDS